MSKGMLGMLPLSEVQGLRADLEEKLASDSGPEWRNELKKYPKIISTMTTIRISFTKPLWSFIFLIINNYYMYTLYHSFRDTA